MARTAKARDTRIASCPLARASTSRFYSIDYSRPWPERRMNHSNPAPPWPSTHGLRRRRTACATRRRCGGAREPRASRAAPPTPQAVSERRTPTRAGVAVARDRLRRQLHDLTAPAPSRRARAERRAQGAKTRRRPPPREARVGAGLHREDRGRLSSGCSPEAPRPRAARRRLRGNK